MKEISVIMPVYNAEDYLEETLLSVINQTFKKSFELIVVNDGSTDNSKMIIENYKKKYPELIITIDKKNTGVSDSRNIAINKAKGRYITFIDSDDLYEFDYLEKLYNTIQQGFDFVSCNYNNFEANNNKISYDKEIETDDIGLYLEKLQTHFLFNQIWNKIYKTNIIKDNNLKFDVNKSIAEDWEFNIKYLSKCHRMKHININLYRYRVTDSGLGFKYRKDSNFIKFNILNETYYLFTKRKIATDYLDRCYIIQIFSYFSVTMDYRNKVNFKQKQKNIKEFVLSDNYRKIIGNIHSKKTIYKLIIFILKTKNALLFSLLGILANRYDKYKKKKTFGI